MNRLSQEQFAQIEAAVPWPYMGGSLDDPEISDWAREWLGPDGGTLSLLNELRAERARLLAARDALGFFLRSFAGIAVLHTEFAARGQRCCIECSRISGAPVPWPCATRVRLINGTRDMPGPAPVLVHDTAVCAATRRALRRRVRALAYGLDSIRADAKAFLNQEHPAPEVRDFVHGLLETAEVASEEIYDYRHEDTPEKQAVAAGERDAIVTSESTTINQT